MNNLLFQSGLFLGSLLLMSVSSYFLTEALERIGTSLRLSDGLLGIVTALGADAPEISSSIMALSAGHQELGLGVVLGSNIFNLAALLGLSAILVREVRVRKAGAFFNGGIALLATIIAALVVTRLLGGTISLCLLGLLLIPYFYILSRSPIDLKRLFGGGTIATFLARAITPTEDDTERPAASYATWRDWVLLLPALAAIVLGSFGIVQAAVWLAARFSIPHAVAGTLGIAALTGIPNVIAAIHLARRGRGSAVETECFNSNTLNLVFGICLPALFVRLGAPSSRTLFALGWTGGMTLVAIVLLSCRGGLRRWEGVGLVLLYLAFVVAIIWSPHFFAR